MKTTARRPAIRGLRPGAPVRRRAGLVLPTVLIVMLTVCLVVGLVSRFSIRSMRLARRTLDVERAFVVAESGLGYGVMQVKNILSSEKIAGIRQKHGTITAPASPDPGFELRVKVVLGKATDTHGTIDTASQAVTVFAGARSLESGVSCALQQVISLDGVTLSDYAVFYDGDFEACPGNGNGLRYTGKVHTNGDIFVTKKAKFERNITCHGSFHNLRKNTRTDDFTDTGNRRKVYIRYGDDAALSAEEKDSSGDSGLKNTLKSGGSLSSTAEYYDSDLADDGWSTIGLLYYGKAIQTGTEGIPRMDPPIGVDDDNRALIEPPTSPTDVHYNADTESQKLANKAALYLKVHADGSFDLYKQTGTPENPIRTKIGDSGSMERPDLATWSVTDEFFDYGNLYGTHRKINYMKDSSKGNTYVVQNNGAISTDDCFIDHRVWWVMKPVDIYLDKLLASGTTTRDALDAIDSSGGNGKIDKILYVEMPDSLDPLPTTWKETAAGPLKTNAWVRPFPCVRIRNGADLMGSDLTIATSQPVYVEGNFNTGGKWYTDPATVSETLPSAMIAADRVTLLSSAFQQYKGHDAYLGKNAYADGSKTGKEGTTADGRDSAGNRVINEWDPERARQGKWQPMGQMYLGAGGKKRWIRDCGSNRTPAAGNTTINAVIMSGIYPSVDAQDLLKDNITPNSDLYYSGGLENILRLDEYWTDATLAFNGSVICLYDSEKPDYRWQTYAKVTQYPGGDQLFGNQVWRPPASEKQWSYVRMTPPGMPNFYAAAESAWARIPWSVVWTD